MNLILLEKRVRDVCDRAKAKQPLEDSLVELKREWPSDPVRAARRLAGLSNAARGNDVLLLIGVDETHGVVGATGTDTATWWPPVRSVFDEGAPDLLQDHVIEVEGQPVVALLFGTGAAPFVVKVAKVPGSDIDREVPWREGTAVRTARRGDLIRVLYRSVLTPDAELLLATVNTRNPPKSGQDNIHVRLMAYLTPRDASRVVLPRHRVTIRVESQTGQVISLSRCHFIVREGEPLATASGSGLIAEGPCRFALDAAARVSPPPKGSEIRVTATLALAGDVAPLILAATLVRDATDSNQWDFSSTDAVWW